MKNSSNTILLFLCLTCNFLYAQSTFSKRVNLDFPALAFLGLEATDSCFYASGIIVDSIQPYQIGFAFAKFDWEGNLVFLNETIDTPKTLETRENDLTAVGNDFISAGMSVDGSIVSGMLIKVDDQGDTVFLKIYENPVWPEGNQFLIQDVYPLPSGELVCIALLGDENLNSPFYFFRTDSFGNILAENVHYDVSGHYPYVIKAVPNNDEFIIGSLLFQDPVVDLPDTSYIAKLNINGDILWEYTLSNNILSGSVSDLLVQEDGSIIFLGRALAETNGTAGHYQNVNFLSPNQELVWSTPFRDSFLNNRPEQYLHKIIALQDNEHFVAAGISRGSYHTYGKIIKGSFDGDSLWTRYIHHVNTTSAYNHLLDVEQSPDGGFILCGQAADFVDYTPEDPLSQGWLLKVDEYGCLVPGCHLTSSTEENQDISFEISAYPNPATDYINVYFKHKRQVVEAEFQLVDASGKVLLAFQSNHGDITHVIPVYELASGMYWLRCQVGKEILTREILVGR